MRARTLAFFALLSLPLFGVACAEAGEIGLDEEEGNGVLPAVDGGDSGATTRGDGGSATPPKGSSSSSGGTDAGGSSGASGGTGTDAGASSSGGSSSSSGGAGQADVCTGSISCGSSTDIGFVYGDYASSTSHSAKQSKWVSFKVEDDSVTGFTNHSYELKFTPAAGVNYEVRLGYCEFAGSDACDPCGASGTLIPPARYASFKDAWADVPFSGDHRQIAVFVKQVDGTCPTTANWRIDVTGKVAIP